MPHRKTSLLFAASVATMVVLLTAAVGPFTLLWTNQARLNRNVVEHQLESIRRVQSLLVEAETGQRGYVLTGKEMFLQPYFIASSLIPKAVDDLRAAYEGDLPEEVAQVEDFIQNAERKMGHLDSVVKLRSESGFDAAEAEVASGRGKELMDSVRSVSADLIFHETAEVAELDDRLQSNLRWAVFLSAMTSLATLVLGRFIFVSMRQNVRRQADLARRENESAANAIAATTQLAQSMTDLEERNREVGLLAELAQLLQTELSQEEVLELSGSYCERLLPTSEGTFYLYRNSADALQPAAAWGRLSDEETLPMSPRECWAIRRGRKHIVLHAHDIPCSHYSRGPDSDSNVHWCLPLSAYGEVLGLLYIRFANADDAPQARLQFAEAIAEQTALALANGRMREILKRQSIKDPLTNLYNRRFMEETLERELSRAKRSQAALSVVMLDLDNFKSLNDRYGHPAGDAVLQTCAAILQRSLRASDVACRFGGEELMVILPDCPIEGAAARAEAIRATLQATVYKELGKGVMVTASFGVACTTHYGYDPNALIKAADSALYNAKRNGKNQVAIQTEGVPRQKWA